MRFTLTYAGPLLGNRARIEDKHAIRRALHPQMKALWQQEPLSHNAGLWLAQAGPDPDEPDPEHGRALRRVGNHRYAVLVQSRLNLVAELEILLLRPEKPGGILQRADIDNRLKTLFDALRRPDTGQQVPASWMPTADEEPLFCLLDDDRLVTRVSVDTDRLLASPHGSDDVQLTIRVQIRGSAPSWSTMEIIY